VSSALNLKSALLNLLYFIKIIITIVVYFLLQSTSRLQPVTRHLSCLEIAACLWGHEEPLCLMSHGVMKEDHHLLHALHLAKAHI
jgi:hypothetical protein